MTTLHIVGGGIAGLTLAATLRRPDWQVVVHEQGRPAHESEVGTAFGMWPAALRALDEIGLGDAVRERGTRCDRGHLRTADDRTIARMSGQKVVMIGRIALQELLRDARPPAVIRSNECITDPRSLDGDVIVGADGARSVVRREVWGVAESTLRLTVIRGVVDAELSGGEAREYWGDGRLFGITPLHDSRTNWFTAFPEQRFASTADGLAHTRRAASSFPRPVRDVLDQAREELTLVNGISTAPPMTSFVRGRHVLIGDAAHAMTPNLGRGACESIRDAVSLGTLLNAFEPAEALRRYRGNRLIGPQLFRTASGIMARLALASGRAATARDRLLARGRPSPTAATMM